MIINRRFLSILVFCLLASFAGEAAAQIVISNSSVTYTYEASSSSPLIPGTSVTVATPDSSLTFFPTELNGNLASSYGGVGTLNGSVLIAMNANPGYWFSGNALSFNTTISYDLAAISVGSNVGLRVSSPYTLTVTSVDYAPFSSLMLPITGSTIFSEEYVTIDGPFNFQTGFITGTGILPLNTLKSHFGIGADNNITGMVLTLAPSGTAWVEGGGSVVGNMARLQVDNQIAVVPEPSTYALLLVSGLSLACLARRRR